MGGRVATANSDSSGQVKTDAQPATLIELLGKQLELFTTQLTSLSNQFDKERKDYLKRGNKARVLYWFLGWPSALLATVQTLPAAGRTMTNEQLEWWVQNFRGMLRMAYEVSPEGSED